MFGHPASFILLLKSTFDFQTTSSHLRVIRVVTQEISANVYLVLFINDFISNLDVHPGHCPLFNYPIGSVRSDNCTSDSDCLDSQKCCNTSYGMKCLTSKTVPGMYAKKLVT